MKNRLNGNSFDYFANTNNYIFAKRMNVNEKVTFFRQSIVKFFFSDKIGRICIYIYDKDVFPRIG